MTAKDKQQAIKDELLLSAARTTLQDSVDGLDQATQQRLAAIRRQAVEAATTPRASWANLPGWVLPVGGFATLAAAVLVATTLWTIRPDQQTAPVAVLEDINLLTDSEEL